MTTKIILYIIMATVIMGLVTCVAHLPSEYHLRLYVAIILMFIFSAEENIKEHIDKNSKK